MPGLILFENRKKSVRNFRTFSIHFNLTSSVSLPFIPIAYIFVPSETYKMTCVPSLKSYQTRFLHSLISVHCPHEENKKCHKHVTNAPKGIGLA